MTIDGVDMLVGGNIPGSGLSSSASLTVGLIYALSQAANRPLQPLQLALAAQRVEHEYVGVQCGLMDQAAITLARTGAALLFDCAEHRYTTIAVDDATVRFVVVDTGRARQLVDSAYNARLNETREAAAILGVEAQMLATSRAGHVRSEPGTHRRPCRDAARSPCRFRKRARRSRRRGVRAA